MGQNQPIFEPFQACEANTLIDYNYTYGTKKYQIPEGFDPYSNYAYPAPQPAMTNNNMGNPNMNVPPERIN